MADTAENDTVLGDRETISVGVLNEHIFGVLDQTSYLSGVVVGGEVASYGESSGGVHFTLSEEDEEHSISCSLPKWRFEKIEVPLSKGDEVVLDADVNYWKEQGKLQLVPNDIALVGEGALQAKREQLLGTLREKGWLDDEHKRSVPGVPTTVGVVTSENGDAWHDIRDEIHDRAPITDLILHPASVQGRNASEELAEGIRNLDRADIDFLIVGRGGGSDHHLVAFDSEEVATAIFNAETPVVSAVGHREDSTIACEVADNSAITPTAAGEKVAEIDDLFNLFESQSEQIGSAYRNRVDDQLARQTEVLRSSYQTRVDNQLGRHTAAFTSSYSDLVHSRLNEMETELERAYQEVERETAVADAERNVPTAYKIALVALVVLVLVLIGAMLL